MSAVEAEAARAVTSIDKALLAAKAAQSKRGQAATVVDVEGRCSYTDAILIVSATSERQAAAIGKAIEEELRERCGVKPLHREPQGSWVLLDFGDVLVHVFLEETRAYYDIDTLWTDAPRVPVPAPEAVEESRPTALARRGR